MNTMRSTFYNALRAAPTYPQRAGGLLLMVAVTAITYGVWGWPAVVIAFVVTALWTLRAVDGVGEAIMPLLVVATLAAGSIWVLVQHSAGLLFLAAVVGLLAVTGRWLLAEVAPPFSTKGVIERRGDREQRAGGVASMMDVAERASRVVMQRRAVVMRPSMAGIKRRKVDPWAVASLIAVQDGWRGLRRLTRSGREVWVICRDSTLRVGGPGTGKTVSLALIAAKAPGALLTTSTRLDLAEWVHEARRSVREYRRRSFREWLQTRRELGWRKLRQHLEPLLVAEFPRAVHVFNPTGFGDVPSTVRWSILVGCENYSTAVRRGGDLIPEGDSAEGERWDGDARLYLPVLLHAAALAGHGVEQVQQWLRDIALDETAERAQRAIVNILARDAGADERIALLGQFVSTTSRTRSGILKSMTPALAWMSDDVARLIGAAPLRDVTLDIPRLIRECETLHIVGPDASTGMIAPLVSALVAEIAEQVRMIAGVMPSGRLDPPLTMALDEIAVTVRLPLDRWSADMGGRGIAIHMGVQSLSQLTARWGKAGAATLLGNIGTLILFGGGKDAEEMESVSKLCGEYRMRVVGEDHDGVDKRKDGERRGESRWRPVLSASALTNLPQYHAAIIQRGLGGLVVARTPTTLDAGMTPMPLIEKAVEVVEPVAASEPHLALLPAPRPEAAA